MASVQSSGSVPLWPGGEREEREGRRRERERERGRERERERGRERLSQSICIKVMGQCVT